MRLILLWAFALILPFGGSWAEPSVETTFEASNLESQISFEEFEDLVVEMSRKVNLFKAVWENDPSAEFFGGTVRDFTYWVRGQLSGASSPSEFQERLQNLRQRSHIDIREFISFESDVDIHNFAPIGVSPDQFGIKRIDFISGSRFDYTINAGWSEVHQGFIPQEKIRLSRKGVVQWQLSGADNKIETLLNSGIRNIYEGVVEVYYANREEFQKTDYAMQGLNHPILLALRYVRALALNYYYLYGKGAPDLDLLMNFPARGATKAIISSTTGEEMGEYFKNQRFMKYLNDTIRKSFRAYTNPTASYKLYEALGLLDFLKKNQNIQSVNQYLFSFAKDEKKILQNLEQLKLKVPDAEKMFQLAESVLPESSGYHGTSSEAAFLSIIYQGVLPSVNGFAGPGFYMVSKDNIEFARIVRALPELVVGVKITPEAKVVDITSGIGQRAFEAFAGSIDEFTEAFGIDVIKYPYTVPAYVVKNGAVIESAWGVYRQIVPIEEFIVLSANMRSAEDLLNLLLNFEINAISEGELKEILSASRWTWMRELFKSEAFRDFENGAREGYFAAPLRLALAMELEHSLKGARQKRQARRLREKYLNKFADIVGKDVGHFAAMNMVDAFSSLSRFEGFHYDTRRVLKRLKRDKVLKGGHLAWFGAQFEPYDFYFGGTMLAAIGANVAIGDSIWNPVVVAGVLGTGLVLYAKSPRPKVPFRDRMFAVFRRQENQSAAIKLLKTAPKRRSSNLKMLPQEQLSCREILTR